MYDDDVTYVYDDVTYVTKQDSTGVGRQGSDGGVC